MNHNHPSLWPVPLATAHPGKSRASEYKLPMPQPEKPMIVSTYAVKGVLRAYTGRTTTPNNAGHLANAIEVVLERTKNDLTKLMKVNQDGATALCEWLTAYKTACRAHSKGDLLDHRIVTEDKPEPKPEKKPEKKKKQEKPEGKAPVYDQIVAAAIAGFAMHSGPLTDAKLLAERAKAIADEYEKLK